MLCHKSFFSLVTQSRIFMWPCHYILRLPCASRFHAVSANRILWVYAGFWWYMILSTCWGKKGVDLHIIPSDLDNLLDIFRRCSFHVKCWSIAKLKKLKSSLICSFNFNCVIRFSMFRYVWWKITNFVFFTLSERLYTSNHICLIFSSLLILADNSILLQLLSIFTSTEHSMVVKFVSSFIFYTSPGFRLSFSSQGIFILDFTFYTRYAVLSYFLEVVSTLSYLTERAAYEQIGNWKPCHCLMT